MKKIPLILILSIFISVLNPVYAELRITELYPAPVSPETEWVEIFWDGTGIFSPQAVHLEDATGKVLLLTPPFPDGSGYLIATSAGVLNNSGDTVFLIDGSGSIIDSITYTTSFTSSESYTRCDDQWQKTTIITKNLDNSASCILSPTPTPEPITPTPQEPPEITQTPSPTPTSLPHITPSPAADPVDIYLTEIMAYPASGNPEWIELYNASNTEAHIQNWFIDDIANGGSSPKSVSLDIPPKSYRIVTMSSALFNNSGDDIRLLSNTGETIRAFTIPASTENVTWGLTTISDTTLCEQSEPTPGAINAGCAAEHSPTPTLTPLPSLTPAPTTPQSETFLNKDKINKSTPHTLKKIQSQRIKRHTPSWLIQGTKPRKSHPRSFEIPMNNASVQKSEGEEHHAQKRNKLSPIPPLSSMASSFLTIVSVLYKMKHRIPG